MALAPLCSTLIFDIGDVLFSWSPDTSTSITPLQLKAILRSTVWHAYECGRLQETECYDRIALQFALDPEQVRRAFQDARDSLKPDNQFLAFVRKLQAESGGQLRIFAMSNISAPDYDVLRLKQADWSIFERVFTSAKAGVRKPNLGFYRHVLAETNTNISTAVFVDDNADNVLAARTCGIKGIVFDDIARARRLLRNYVGEPVSRAYRYLVDHAGEHDSVTNTGVKIGDNFSQLLMLEATGNRYVAITDTAFSPPDLIHRSLVKYSQFTYKWNFFRGDIPVFLSSALFLTIHWPLKLQKDLF
jgi:FMN phosphatase YigB (HAD superfamily)